MSDERDEARLTMQDKNVDLHVRIRPSVCRRLFQDEENQNSPEGTNPIAKNDTDESSVEATREGNNDDERQGRNEGHNSGAEDDDSFLQEVRSSNEEAKKRWNFDFEREIPLPGNFEWVKLDRHGNEIPTNSETENASPRTPEKDEE